MTKKKSVSFDGGPVGYGRPPAEHQFKRGQKPPGSGRRKGARNYETIVNEILEQPVPVTVDGKKKKMPARDALLRKAFASAMNGDLAAIERLFRLYARLAPQHLEPEQRPIPVQMIPGDESI